MNKLPLFELGQLCVTNTIANDILNDPLFAEFYNECVFRHHRGDWGDLCDENKQVNNEALKNGSMILSSYSYVCPKGKREIYVITEADRSVTTVCYPGER